MINLGSAYAKHKNHPKMHVRFKLRPEIVKLLGKKSKKNLHDRVLGKKNKKNLHDRVLGKKIRKIFMIGF